MLRKIYEKIKNKEDLKNSVLELKTMLREDLKEDTHNTEAFLYILGGDYSVILKLLDNEDAKIRKNAAIILGELGKNEFLNPLYEAYEKEEMRFVKSAYLEAIGNLDFRPVLDKIKLRIAELSATELNDENRKHIGEEFRLLNNLVHMAEGVKKHIYTEEKLKLPVTAVLLTNRNHIHVTSEQLIKLNEETENQFKFKEFNAGVMVKTKTPSALYQIRTFSELLFMCDDVKTVSKNENEAASILGGKEVINFIKQFHKEETPFYFRLEVKSKDDEEKRIRFAKRVSAQIAINSNGMLVNSTDSYEAELRLIENKEGNYNVLIKLYTMPDDRFLYRKEAVAASIKPVNAALCASLAKDYLKENAQVLDPFCGTGTMVIERHKALKTRNIYGIDIFGKAIDKARINAENARLTANFINRDFFDFKHEYLFDEIFTDMPFSMQKSAKNDIDLIYCRFFNKAAKHLTDEGTIIMYSHDRAVVKKYVPSSEFKIIKEFEISMKEGTYLYILKKNTAEE